MDMSQPVSAAVDCEALAAALSALGLHYGSHHAIMDAAANAIDESEAIRIFIRTERPHLLHTYSLDDLVSLVMSARTCNARAPASIETYSPA
jgi:hypothetical protein